MDSIDTTHGTKAPTLAFFLLNVFTIPRRMLHPPPLPAPSCPSPLTSPSCGEDAEGLPSASVCVASLGLAATALVSCAPSLPRPKRDIAERGPELRGAGAAWPAPLLSGDGAAMTEGEDAGADASICDAVWRGTGGPPLKELGRSEGLRECGRLGARLDPACG